MLAREVWLYKPFYSLEWSAIHKMQSEIVNFKFLKRCTAITDRKLALKFSPKQQKSCKLYKLASLELRLSMWTFQIHFYRNFVMGPEFFIISPYPKYRLCLNIKYLKGSINIWILLKCSIKKLLRRKCMYKKFLFPTICWCLERVVGGALQWGLSDQLKCQCYVHAVCTPPAVTVHCTDCTHITTPDLRPGGRSLSESPSQDLQPDYPPLSSLPPVSFYVLIEYSLERQP